jgi:hypothetical protein
MVVRQNLAPQIYFLGIEANLLAAPHFALHKARIPRGAAGVAAVQKGYANFSPSCKSVTKSSAL